MQTIINFGKKVIDLKNFSSGTAAIIELTNNMWAVVVTDSENWIIASKNFTFTDVCKNSVQKNCRKYYRYCKDCLSKKQVHLIEEYDG